MDEKLNGERKKQFRNNSFHIFFYIYLRANEIRNTHFGILLRPKGILYYSFISKKVCLGHG